MTYMLGLFSEDTSKVMKEKQEQRKVGVLYVPKATAKNEIWEPEMRGKELVPIHNGVMDYLYWYIIWTN